MCTFDFSPLFRRSVNFDHLQHLVDATNRLDPKANSHPPYNIEQVGKNGYHITMAVANFGENDLDVNVKENTLVISGKLAGTEDDVKVCKLRHRWPRLRAPV